MNNKLPLRELQVMDAIKHENIIALKAVFLDYSEIGFVMEHFSKNNLRNVLKKYDLSLDAKLDICIQICEVIKYMHTNHETHKDIKTDNILVNDSIRIKLIDYGYSKLANFRPELQSAVGYYCISTPSTWPQKL